MKSSTMEAWDANSRKNDTMESAKDTMPKTSMLHRESTKKREMPKMSMLATFAIISLMPARMLRPVSASACLTGSSPQGMKSRTHHRHTRKATACARV